MAASASHTPERLPGAVGAGDAGKIQRELGVVGVEEITGEQATAIGVEEFMGEQAAAIVDECKSSKISLDNSAHSTLVNRCLVVQRFFLLLLFQLGKCRMVMMMMERM